MTRTVLIQAILLAAVCASAFASPAIEEIDRIRLAEVYHIGEKLQDRIWPDWSTAPFGILFVTDDNEFLIRHPKPNNEFVSIGYDKLLKSEVFVRPRKFPKSFQATFPAFDSTPVIVIGKAENTADKTSTRWVCVVLHEHFHQLQYSRPNYMTDTAGLGLSGGDTSGMWQINYAFPYKEEAVANQFRKLTDMLSRAYEAKTKNEQEQTLRAYLAARKAFADSLKPNDFKYMSFQLFQEGIARYTQIRMAELAGRKAKPSKAFRSLADFTPFDKEAERLHNALRKEMHDLDLKTWERTVFYPFGAIEGLLLDRLNRRWQEKYFAEKFSLEKYYPEQKIG